MEGVAGFAEALADYDPFCFKKADGRFQMFKTYSDAYLELLQRLKDQFPAGYIDIIVFLVDNCSMKYNYALSYLPQLERLGCNVRNDRDWSGVVLVNWKKFDDSVFALERIAQGMHLILGTEFNRDMFKNAVERFKLKNKIFE